ncbi:polyprotein, core/E1 region [Anopheles sinensis]|uniref:Polyprotein, core/E1 region n=1 Tax=Anopheles sinensis TaxID=74873 RepID=A0A084VEY5_ANOSI|nr:polyprotein, core/E1 region [Anopheles sinensis]
MEYDSSSSGAAQQDRLFSPEAYVTTTTNQRQLENGMRRGKNFPSPAPPSEERITSHPTTNWPLFLWFASGACGWSSFLPSPPHHVLATRILRKVGKLSLSD